MFLTHRSTEFIAAKPRVAINQRCAISMLLTGTFIMTASNNSTT